MKKISIVAFVILLLTLPLLSARLKVVGTYQYIRDLTEKLGGDRVTVQSMTNGKWDPHVIIPKPSLIAIARTADLLIMNGAQLEIGWLPSVLRQANNPRIMPSKKGFLDLSNYVELIQVPDSVSRAQGDIHPAGNPHFYLGPQNIPPIARAIHRKLCEIDPDHQSHYARLYEQFTTRWQEHKARWDRAMAPLKGNRYIEFHKNQDYFLLHFGLEITGTVEPLPGIPPTSRHTLELINRLNKTPVTAILHDVYHSIKCSRMIGGKTGTPVIIMPHDVGAVKEAEDIFSLFDVMVERLTR